MDWTWEELKKEVDEAHRIFFEKRGINPDSMNQDFLFGKQANDGGIPSLFESRNARPKMQSSGVLSRSQVDQLL